MINAKVRIDNTRALQARIVLLRLPHTQFTCVGKGVLVSSNINCLYRYNLKNAVAPIDSGTTWLTGG